VYLIEDEDQVIRRVQQHLIEREHRSPTHARSPARGDEPPHCLQADQQGACRGRSARRGWPAAGLATPRFPKVLCDRGRDRWPSRAHRSPATRP
jgi:hypothetical protein